MLHNEARKLLVEGYEATHNAEAIAKIFHVNKYTVYHLEERKRKTGSVDLQTWRRGRKALLSSADKARIAERITKNSTISLGELRTQLGLKVSISTMSRVVRALGFRVKKVGLSATERERPRCAGKTYQVERVKAPPHNSAARLAMPFPPSAACKFLDLPPVNLRNLHLHLTKNPFASRPPHLCGVTLILFGKVSDFPAKQSCPLFLLVSIPPNWANDARTRKKVDKKQKNTRKTLDIAY